MKTFEGVRAGWMREVSKTIQLGTIFAIAITIIWGAVDGIGDAVGR